MTVSEKHAGLRIIGPRPVEHNGLRGFVTTFEFGNTHSVALLPPGATEAGSVQPSADPATHHASRNGRGEQ
ncbi:hypothetical protein DES43_15610 [Aquamicrobium defluvii]|uniref:Uncharacterized protein n=1 Tax=Aquamicrobium defluvii TaxID=69279 RepID=A0A4R6Y159_9HYPH|nr:hypothetical protein DES43_15610 [Aquamicrobium defluvii]